MNLDTTTSEESVYEDWKYDSPHGWEESIQAAVASGNTFEKHLVDPLSSEFRQIKRIFPKEYKINHIERTVNPVLWKKFKAERKYVMQVKSTNLKILDYLNIPECDRLARAVMAKTAPVNPMLPSYSEHLALLCHGVRSPNLDDIWKQGLDPRVGSPGLLGQGIYLADDPRKSSQYDANGVLLLVLVLLGDCIDYGITGLDMTREPTKPLDYQRNANDMFFDSLIARPPDSTTGHSNEYMVFNAARCYPMYAVTYDRPNAIPSWNENIYDAARMNGPMFTFGQVKIQNTDLITIPVQKNVEWPFFAKSIFKAMEELDQRTKENVEELNLAGFMDNRLNLVLLTQNDGDMHATLNSLFDLKTEELVPIEVITIDDDDEEDHSVSSHSRSPKSTSDTTDDESEVTNMAENDDHEECPVCYGTINLKTIPCSHIICAQCHQKRDVVKTTMAGVEHNYIQCTVCREIHGTKVGDCPDGTMRVAIIKRHCDGYKDDDTIVVTYTTLHTQYTRFQVVYLPHNSDGKEILRLLTIAWDRRLLFTIGNSMTTNLQNVLVWNIHQKTSMSGGATNYGYPDPDYFERVRKELKDEGVE